MKCGHVCVERDRIYANDLGERNSFGALLVQFWCISGSFGAVLVQFWCALLVHFFGTLLIISGDMLNIVDRHGGISCATLVHLMYMFGMV